MIKRIGIVADDFKVEKFREELTKDGFADFDEKQLPNGVTSFYLMVEEDRIPRVAEICRRVELHFKLHFNRN
jgi:hypothetical protein